MMTANGAGQLQDNVVALLEKIADERQLNGTRLAALLGVHKDMWSKTRLGKADLGWSICAGALRAFGEDYPALKEAILAYMAATPAERVRESV